MRDRHRSRADRDNAEGRERRCVEPQRGKYGGEHTRGSGDRHRRGALRRFQYRGQHEGEEYADRRKDAGIFRDVLHHPRDADHLAEHAAGGGNEKYRADGLQGVVSDLVEVLRLAGLDQQDYAEDDADRKRDDRGTEEDNGGDAHLRHREGRGQSHEEDRNDYRGKRHHAAREPAILNSIPKIGQPNKAPGL